MSTLKRFLRLYCERVMIRDIWVERSPLTYPYEKSITGLVYRLKGNDCNISKNLSLFISRFKETK